MDFRKEKSLLHNVDGEYIIVLNNGIFYTVKVLDTKPIDVDVEVIDVDLNDYIFTINGKVGSLIDRRKYNAKTINVVKK